MAKKELTYFGKTLEQLKSLSLEQFAALVPARARRALLKRGFTAQEKNLLKLVRAGKNNIETHCRNMVIVPEMLGLTFKVHNGNSFVPVTIEPEMLGHLLGEFALTRKPVKHSAPGIGATKSSQALAVK